MLQPFTSSFLFAIAACFSLATPCDAAVRLPKIVGSNMVLQRDATVQIWGWAEAGEEVRVRGDWSDEQKQTTAGADGRWSVDVQTTAAGGPHTLTIAGTNTIAVDNILFGEVWIASGQSNMEMPLGKLSGTYSGVANFEQEIAAADYPQIRLFQVGNFSSKQPADDVDPGVSMYGVPKAACRWEACRPKNISTFASTAYFFAHELHKKLGVPIGIIDASWGGTRIESWMPAEGLQELGYRNELAQAKSLPQQPGVKIPTRLYNGMIHPLRNVKVRGVIWYQGEQNAAQAGQYHRLFRTMIAQWRSAFDQEFPFYFAQAAPYNYGITNAAYLREAQLETHLLSSGGDLPKTGLVVTLDIGDLTDVHPTNKQEVGRRLALWALAKDYGHDIECSGPIYRGHTMQANKIRVAFDHADGLTTRDGRSLVGFEVAGVDRAYYPATAVIEEEDVIVSSSHVAQPIAVRYAFTSQGVGNLMNKAGLPASSFRTDRW